MTVTIATESDWPDLLELCQELEKENGFFKMDYGLVRSMFDRAFKKQGGIVAIIRGEKEIEGCLFMIISTMWYSHESHLEELFSYVRPAYRKSKHAITLVEFAKDCSVKIGIPLMVGILTHNRMEAKVRLYRRTLGIPAGAFFVFNSDYINDTSGTDLWSLHTRNRKKNIPTTNGSSMPPMTLA